MAFNRKKEVEETPPQDRVIEINAQMHGEVTFSDPVNLKINGSFKGRLDVKGTLTVGSAGQVEANIHGENVVIAGKVKGNIMARKMLVLMPTAVLHGDISTAKLNIVEGAVFQGHCQMFDEFLNVEELASYLEIENSAIVELAADGKIPAFKDGESWKFERSKIDLWASAGKLQ